MSKVIKNIGFQWTWEGDENALEGFKVAVTPQGSHPDNDSKIIARDLSSPYTRQHTFYNLSIEVDTEIDVWVQALVKGKDSDWLNQGGVTINDKKGATIVEEQSITQLTKNTIPKSETAPTNPSNGQLWLQLVPDGIYLMKYNGSSWDDVTTNLNGSMSKDMNVYKSKDDPIEYAEQLIKDNDLWIDTTPDPPILKQRIAGLWDSSDITDFLVGTSSQVEYLGNTANWNDVRDNTNTAPVDNADITKRAETLTIAAHNSSEKGIAGADYVCSGSGDDITIMEAINELGFNGGSVVLLEGLYTLDEPIKIFSNLSIRGVGKNTMITTSSTFKDNFADNKDIFTYYSGYPGGVYQSTSTGVSKIKVFDGKRYFPGDVIKYETDNSGYEYNKIIDVIELFPDDGTGDWAEIVLKNATGDSISGGNEAFNATIMKDSSIRSLTIKNIENSRNLFNIKGGFNAKVKEINLLDINNTDNLFNFQGETSTDTNIKYTTHNTTLEDIIIEDSDSIGTLFATDRNCSKLTINNLGFYNITNVENNNQFEAVKNSLNINNLVLNNVTTNDPNLISRIMTFRDCTENLRLANIRMKNTQDIIFYNCANFKLVDVSIETQGIVRIWNNPYGPDTKNIKINGLNLQGQTTGYSDNGTHLNIRSNDKKVNDINILNTDLSGKSRINITRSNGIKINNLIVRDQLEIIPLYIKESGNITVGNSRFENWERSRAIYVELVQGFVKVTNSDFILNDTTSTNNKTCVSLVGNYSTVVKREFIVKDCDFKSISSNYSNNQAIFIKKEDSTSISVAAHNEVIGDLWDVGGEIVTRNPDGSKVTGGADETLGGNLKI